MAPGYKRMSINATGFVRFLLKEMKFGKYAKHDVKFRYSCNAFRIRRKVGKGSDFM